jgi:hypothetical protein
VIVIAIAIASVIVSNHFLKQLSQTFNGFNLKNFSLNSSFSK